MLKEVMLQENAGDDNCLLRIYFDWYGSLMPLHINLSDELHKIFTIILDVLI